MTIQAGSRYEEADTRFTYSHLYDEFGHPVLDETLSRLQYRIVSRQATYLTTTLPLPPPPPAQYYAKEGETLPFIAYLFQRNSLRWSEIAEVNPHVWHPLDLKPGTVLQVPS